MNCCVMLGIRMKNVKPLHARQLHAIRLLAAGTPDYLVAQRIEVSTMTIYRWKRQDDFNRELRQITYSGLEDFSKKLSDCAVNAIETLHEVMNDLREPSTHRSKVALGVINALPKLQVALAHSARHSVECSVIREETEDADSALDSGGIIEIGID